MINVYDGFMTLWVNIQCMIDCIIGFAHETAEIHFLCMIAQLVSAQNEMLLFWEINWKLCPKFMATEY